MTHEQEVNALNAISNLIDEKWENVLDEQRVTTDPVHFIELQDELELIETMWDVIENTLEENAKS